MPREQLVGVRGTLETGLEVTLDDDGRLLAIQRGASSLHFYGSLVQLWRVDDDPERFTRALVLFHLAGRVMPDIRLDEDGHGSVENCHFAWGADGWIEVVARYDP